VTANSGRTKIGIVIEKQYDRILTPYLFVVERTRTGMFIASQSIFT